MLYLIAGSSLRIHSIAVGVSDHKEAVVGLTNSNHCGSGQLIITIGSRSFLQVVVAGFQTQNDQLTVDLGSDNIFLGGCEIGTQIGFQVCFILAAGSISVLTADIGVQVIQNVNALDVGGDHIYRLRACLVAVHLEYCTGQMHIGIGINLFQTQCIYSGGSGAGFIRAIGGIGSPAQVCGVPQVVALSATDCSTGFHRCVVLNDNLYGRGIDRLCVLTIGQAEVIGGSFKVVVVHPGNHDVEGIKSTVNHVPLGIVSVCFLSLSPGAKVLPLAGVMSACNAMVVTTIQLLTVNINLYAVELYPKGIALGIGNSIVLDLLLAIIVGGIEPDLEVNNIANVCRGIYDPLLGFFIPKLLAEIRSGNLVLVNNLNIGSIAVDGNSSINTLVDQIITVGQIVEHQGFSSCCFTLYCSKAIRLAANHIGQVTNDVAVLSPIFSGNGTGYCVINKVCIFGLAVCTKHIAEELVFGSDAVGNSICVAVCIGAISSIENLIQAVRIVNGSIGDGDGTGILSRKGGDAERKNHSQHHKDR